jgi:rhamnosyltransferase
MKWSIIVPTLNAEKDWAAFSSALLTCAQPDQILILDSSSSDRTVELARTAGFSTHSISRTEFNHGGTRQLAAELSSEAELLIYMTQDAVLSEPDSLKNLLKAFDDPSVAAAYGRQLPRPGAGAMEAHLRIFNYPSRSSLRSQETIMQFGLKTIFISNSFAAYRRAALMEIGGFPANVIFGEDTITAARLILSGYKIAYVAEACVYHSHSYMVIEDFKRYFDIGVLHDRESWLQDHFGKAGGEGKRYLVSELRYMWANDPWRIPLSLAHIMAKYAGYKLGRHEEWLPLAIKRKLSMHPRFWASIYANRPHPRTKVADGA